jgi:hypothetical protein
VSATRSEPPVCTECGHEYTYTDYAGPDDDETGVCDRCAHVAVKGLRASLQFLAHPGCKDGRCRFHASVPHEANVCEYVRRELRLVGRAALASVSK